MVIRQRWRMRQRSPFHPVPLTGQRQMDANVDTRQIGKSIRRVTHPGARHHHLYGARDPIAHRTLAALIGREARAGVIDANKKPGVGRRQKFTPQA